LTYLSSVASAIVDFAGMLKTQLDHSHLSPVIHRSIETAMKSKILLDPICNAFEKNRSDDSVYLFMKGYDSGIDFARESAKSCRLVIQEKLEVLVRDLSVSWNGTAASLRKKCKILFDEQRVLVETPTNLKPLFTILGHRPVEETKKVCRYEIPSISVPGAELIQKEETYCNKAIAAIRAIAEEFFNHFSNFIDLNDILGELDALISFTSLHRTEDPILKYSRPTFTECGHKKDEMPCLEFEALWNPLIAQASPASKGPRPQIQANNIAIGGLNPSALLLTGANSGGKSTLLKSVCIAVIMAQIGCHVPCQKALICPVDRIMTRMGTFILF